jgi:hypothetical protein
VLAAVDETSWRACLPLSKRLDFNPYNLAPVLVLAVAARPTVNPGKVFIEARKTAAKVDETMRGWARSATDGWCEQRAGVPRSPH